MSLVQYTTLTRSEILGMIMGTKSNGKKHKEGLLQSLESEESIKSQEMKAAACI